MRGGQRNRALLEMAVGLLSLTPGDVPNPPADPKATHVPPAAAEGRARRRGDRVSTAAKARELLGKRYPPPEWALMLEVAPATGGGTRYADAVAVNLWQSRGHAIHGFEIKVSRSDWLAELKQPEKSDPVQQFCDRWWIVAPKSIILPGEMPETWGHIDLMPETLRVVKEAPKLEAQPITRAFFASIMRRGFERLDDIAKLKLDAERRDMLARYNERLEADVKRRTRDHESLQKAVDKFKAQTGLDLDPWCGMPTRTIRIAQALEALCGYDDSALFERLSTVAKELESGAKSARKALQLLSVAEREAA